MFMSCGEPLLGEEGAITIHYRIATSGAEQHASLPISSQNQPQTPATLPYIKKGN